MMKIGRKIKKGGRKERKRKKEWYGELKKKFLGQQITKHA